MRFSLFKKISYTANLIQKRPHHRTSTLLEIVEDLRLRKIFLGSLALDWQEPLGNIGPVELRISTCNHQNRAGDIAYFFVCLVQPPQPVSLPGCVEGERVC